MALAFDFTGVNWLAVLVCGIVSIALGFLWYGPLFGKAWSRAMGWMALTPEQVQAKQKAAGPGYVMSFVGALIVAYAIALIVQVANPTAVMDAIALGIMLWLAFIVPLSYVNAFFQETKTQVTHIGVGYRLLEFLAFTIILTLWV